METAQILSLAKQQLTDLGFVPPTLLITGTASEKTQVLWFSDLPNDTDAVVDSIFRIAYKHGRQARYGELQELHIIASLPVRVSEDTPAVEMLLVGTYDIGGETLKGRPYAIIRDSAADTLSLREQPHEHFPTDDLKRFCQHFVQGYRAGLAQQPH